MTERVAELVLLDLALAQRQERKSAAPVRAITFERPGAASCSSTM